MANTKEIKDRIKSVQDTKKITNAMYLIASTKMRRARAELEGTRPYFNALQGEIKRVFRTAGHVDNKYFFPREGVQRLDGASACLVITADKGLAGAYNQNVIKEAERLRAECAPMKLFVVGEYGRRYFQQKGIPVAHSFLYTAQNPTLHRAREIGTLLLGLYNRGEIDKLFVVYTDMKNSLITEARSTRLLPFHHLQFASPPEDEPEVERPFEFTPSITAVLDNMMESYIHGFIYGALVDSFCSEQNARMTAMDAANRNAQDLLDDLSLRYNRVRQAAITQEITEVSSGVKALRQSKAQR